MTKSHLYNQWVYKASKKYLKLNEKLTINPLLYNENYIQKEYDKFSNDIDKSGLSYFERTKIKIFFNKCLMKLNNHE